MIKITKALVIIVNFVSRDHYTLTLRDVHMGPTFACFNTRIPAAS